MSWPAVDRTPVQLPTLPGHDALWTTLIELSEVRPGDWTLIGGQMVFLHAIEHDATPPRVSTDLDILVNARIVSGALTGHVPRPSLLGAIICKAVAVGVDDAPDAQRLDLAVLLDLVDDPFALIDDLNATDRRRLRARVEMADESNPVWGRLPLERTDRARATLRLLQR